MIEPYIRNPLRVVDFKVEGDIKVSLKDFKGLTEKFRRGQEAKFKTPSGKPRPTPLKPEQMAGEIYGADIVTSYDIDIVITNGSNKVKIPNGEDFERQKGHGYLFQ